MKKAILAVLFLALNVGSAFAGIEGTAGVKADFPNLVRFSPNLTLGLEVSKGVYSIEQNDFSHWIEDDKNYAGYVKFTYTGSLLSFAKR